MAHPNQERWSQLVDAKLRNGLVTQDNLIFNSRYEGDPTSGKVKIPVRDTEVAVKPYDKAKGIDPEAGTTTYLDLNIDQDEAVNELIDGYDAASWTARATAWACPSTRSPSPRWRAPTAPPSAPPRPPPPRPTPTSWCWRPSGCSVARASPPRDASSSRPRSSWRC